MSETSRASIATILFTDLVGSTELMTRVGDERAQGLFAAGRDRKDHELEARAALADARGGALPGVEPTRELAL